MRVALPEARIGTCELVVNYSVPLAALAPGQTIAITLPLVMPKDGKLLANNLMVRAERDLIAWPQKGVWTAANDAAAADSPTTLRLTAAKPAQTLNLEVRRDQRLAAQETVVDRAWVQSWLTSAVRRDRAVFQGATDGRELAVRLPPEAAPDRTIVFLDGRQVQPRVLVDGRLSVPLAGQDPDEGGPARRRFVVELQYDFRGPRPPQGSLCLDFPQLDPDTWIRRMYWQLVLPVNEHLIANPSGFSGECTWNWEGYGWGRRPTADQAQLESWAGATPREPLPEQANCYLFSAMGKIERAEVGTAGRTSIVLWASGAALVAGMFLIYVPRGRHPAVLLALGIGILAVGAMAPEPTLLLAQAASLGLALTLAASLVDRGVGRRRRLTARVMPAAAAIEPGSSRRPYQPSLPANLSPTESLPSLPPPAESIEP